MTVNKFNPPVFPLKILKQAKFPARFQGGSDIIMLTYSSLFVKLERMLKRTPCGKNPENGKPAGDGGLP
jgi:hypothetical protein